MFDPDPDRDDVHRRRLLRGAAGVTAGGLLSGCLGRQRYQPNRAARDDTTTIRQIYPSYFTGSNPGARLRENFEAETEYGFDVVGQVATANAVDTHSYYLGQFNAQSSRFDVGSMDVIWSAEFVQNGWIVPMEDPDLPIDRHLENMIEPAVNAVTVAGRPYAIPMYTDANVLYYRKDLIDEPPKTYAELRNQASEVSEDRPEMEGYLWQGGRNEGLTVNWFNWLWGMNGSVYDGSGGIKVNTQKAVDALGHAASLIEDEITPGNVRTSGSRRNAIEFQKGKAVFMRNWPFARRLLEGVDFEVGIAPLPTHRDHPNASNSCLGGWNLFVNKESYNRKEAKQFAAYAGSKEIQEFLARELSLLPVRSDVYQELPEDNFVNRFVNILDRVRRRPQIPRYQLFSEIVYTECNRALQENGPTPRQALDRAQRKIDEEGIELIDG